MPSVTIASSWLFSTSSTARCSAPSGRKQVGHCPSGPRRSILSRWSFNSSCCFRSSVRRVFAYSFSRTQVACCSRATLSAASSVAARSRASLLARSSATSASANSAMRRSSRFKLRVSAVSGGHRGGLPAFRQACLGRLPLFLELGLWRQPGLEPIDFMTERVATLTDALLRERELLVPQHPRQKRGALGTGRIREHRELFLAGEVRVEELVVRHAEDAPQPVQLHASPSAPAVASRYSTPSFTNVSRFSSASSGRRPRKSRTVSVSVCRRAPGPAPVPPPGDRSASGRRKSS